LPQTFIFAINASTIKTIPSRINHFDKSVKNGKTTKLAPKNPKIAGSVQFPFLFIL